MYALAGEGLGHASRAYAVYERLKDEYEFHFFTFGDAYEFFQIMKVPNLHLIQGIKWVRTNGIIDNAATFQAYANLKDNKEVFEKVYSPGIVCITDFEPTITRFAYKKTKLISIDNQHKFSRCYNKDLGFGLRAYAAIMGWVTELFIKSPSRVVVSTFYHSLAKKMNDSTLTVNVFIRNEFDKNKITNDGTILVYDKNNLFCDKVIPLLAKRGKKVIVYNNKGQSIYGYDYKKIDYENFVADLHRCDRVICTAGNQLLGEAIYLGKPLLVIPEPGQYEQYINAFYIKKMNAGMAYKLNEVGDYCIDPFLGFAADKIAAENGLDETVKFIRREIK